MNTYLSGKYLDSRRRLEGRGRFQMFTYIFNAGIVSNVFRYLTTAQSLRMVATLFLFFLSTNFRYSTAARRLQISNVQFDKMLARKPEAGPILKIWLTPSNF